MADTKSEIQKLVEAVIKRNKLRDPNGATVDAYLAAIEDIKRLCALLKELSNNPEATDDGTKHFKAVKVFLERTQLQKNKIPETIKFINMAFKTETKTMVSTLLPLTSFPNQVLKKPKSGGVNSPGPFGGEYIDTETGERSLFKRDTKNNVPRVGKVIGEGLASILEDLYDQLKVPREQYAKVKLVRANAETSKITDLSGEQVYLRSVFVPGYISDLWKYAYQQKETAQAEARLRSASSSKEVQGILRNSPMSSEGITPVTAAIAIGKQVTDTMSRPSGVTSKEARKVVSNSIQNDIADGVDDFAKLTAPRILIGDFGLHNANYGVANINGKPKLVALDYGAAFLNLRPDLNPFDPNKSGLKGIKKYYKNHFLEYDTDIITSEAMAKAFINLGTITPEKMRMIVNNAFKEQFGNDVYNAINGTIPLRAFCRRMGMAKSDYKNESFDMLKSKAIEFMSARLVKRKNSLEAIGYMILIERHYDDKLGKMSPTFNKHLEDNIGLGHFLQSKAFEKMGGIIAKASIEKVKKAAKTAYNEKYALQRSGLFAKTPGEGSTPTPSETPTPKK